MYSFKFTERITVYDEVLNFYRILYSSYKKTKDILSYQR